MQHRIATLIVMAAGCAVSAPEEEIAERTLAPLAGWMLQDTLIDQFENTVSCFYDADRDGYYPTGAVATYANVPITSVPAGEADKCTYLYGSYYVQANRAGDCDDANAAVHPRTPEVWDGVDNNCAFGIDEPVFLGAAGSPLENATYAKLGLIALRLNHTDVIDYMTTHASVKYKITYEKLEDGAGSEQTSGFLTTSTSGWVGGLFLLMPDSATLGLARRTVYRIKVRFYDALTEVGLGPDTAKFFMMTRGTSTQPNTHGQNGRYHMVTTAFSELVESDEGKTGYRGTVDINGTRYTDPSYPTWSEFDDVGWCDWFYWWVGNHLPIGFVTGFFGDMNPDGIAYSFKDPTYDGCGTEIGDLDGDNINSEQIQPGRTGIGWVDSDCEKYDGDALTTADVLLAGDRQLYTLVPGAPYYDAAEASHAARNPGDFILFGWEGGGAHVGIFLAYYPLGNGTVVGTAGAGGTVYYIAGNEGNTVNVNAIVGTTTEIKSYGKLLLTNFQ